MTTNVSLNFEITKGGSSQRWNFKDARSFQEVFERTCSDLLPKIADVTLEAFQMAQREYHSKSPAFTMPLSKSVRMQENWKGLLLRHFFEDMEIGKQRFWLKKYGYRFFFKKLGPDLKPMNNPTKSSDNLLMQHESTIDIFIGYVPSKEWDEVKTLCAVYISNRSVVWVTNLKPFSTNGPLQLPIFPIEPDIEDGDGLIVKPKIKLADLDVSGKISD